MKISVILSKAALALVCAIPFPAPVWAGDGPAPRDIDAVFERWSRSDTPGCTVAVMKEGAVVFQRGYGMADLDHGIANTARSVFHIASVSKLFTAVAVTRLVQDGKLSFDDSVQRHVPELPSFGKPITVRHLIHHTSGLRDQWELLRLSGWRYSQDRITDGDILSVLRRQTRLNFNAGERYSYSNTGYTLLAQIVARISGKSFRDFTSERLFHPLGMSSTHFRDDFAEIVPDMAYGYVKEGARYRSAVTNFDTVGATSLLTTVEDLAKWDAYFDRSPDELRRLVEPGVANDGSRIDYASGLMLGTYRGLPIVYHGGSDAGYRAHYVRFPQHRFAVAILCNTAEAAPQKLSEKIADLYLGGALQPQPETTAVHVPESGLVPLAGVYVRADGRGARRLLMRDHKLWMTSLDDERAVLLTPLGGARFQIGQGNAQLHVSGDAFRTIPGSTLAQAYDYERAPSFAPIRSELLEYTGTYASPEIEIPYRASVEEGRLVLSSMKLVQGLRLTPFTRDLFVAPEFGTVRFTRDRRGRVSGFLVNTERVVDFRFERERR